MRSVEQLLEGVPIRPPEHIPGYIPEDSVFINSVETFLRTQNTRLPQEKQPRAEGFIPNQTIIDLAQAVENKIIAHGQPSVNGTHWSKKLSPASYMLVSLHMLDGESFVGLQKVETNDPPNGPHEEIREKYYLNKKGELEAVINVQINNDKPEVIDHVAYGPNNPQFDAKAEALLQNAQKLAHIYLAN